MIYYLSACLVNFLSRTITIIFKKTLKEYSDEFGGKLLTLLPIVGILSVRNIINAFSRPHTLMEMCEYVYLAEGKKNKINPSVFTMDTYKDCLGTYTKHYPSIYNTTVDIGLKEGIDKWLNIEKHSIPMAVEAMEPVFLLVTLQILINGCHITLKDVYKINISWQEFFLLLSSLFSIMLVFLLGSIEMDSFDNPEKFLAVFHQLLYPVFALITLVRICSCYIVFTDIIKLHEYESKKGSKMEIKRKNLYAGSKTIRSRGSIIRLRSKSSTNKRDRSFKLNII